jgi:uncharacterized protein
MMRYRLFAAAALVAGFTAVPASAASINCHNQVAADFRMICNDPQLSMRDDRAAALFDQAMGQTDATGQSALRAQRLGFQRQRGACQANRRCMIGAYDDQIATLQSMVRRPRPKMRMVQPGY